MQTLENTQTLVELKLLERLWQVICWHPESMTVKVNEAGRMYVFCTQCGWRSHGITTKNK